MKPISSERLLRRYRYATGLMLFATTEPGFDPQSYGTAMLMFRIRVLKGEIRRRGMYFGSDLKADNWNGAAQWAH